MSAADVERFIALGCQVRCYCHEVFPLLPCQVAVYVHRCHEEVCQLVVLGPLGGDALQVKAAVHGKEESRLLV